jgi:YesN/AraC family two-component response regulator
MPEINGIEFFKEISHLNIKKILLTEYQDYQTVLSAFNSNIINRFLLKTSNNLLTELRACLNQLTREYFIDQTKQLRDNIETDFRLPFSDQMFENFFLNLLRDMNIKEYFLANKYGSFLFMDSNNERFYFIVHTEESLNSFTELYNEPDCKIFVDQIINRKKIPYFGNIDPSAIELSDWNKYLYIPQKLTGEKLYYWSIFKEETYNV